MKLTSEYDSEEQVFVNKASVRLLDGLAKIKASCQTTLDGKWCYPLVRVVTKHLSLDYDVHGRNVLMGVNADVGEQASVSYRRDMQAERSSVSTVLRNKDNSCSAEFILDAPQGKFVPSTLAKATLLFPRGDLRFVSESCEYEERGLSGSISAHVIKGVAVASASQAEGGANLRYHFKNETLTIAPSLSWPSNQMHVTFKRRFNEQHKISMTYEVSELNCSAVYKYTPHSQLKGKMGYDKAAGIAWASAWVGNEAEGCSGSPFNTKAQVMVQVPQSQGLSGAAILFKIKKRIDIL